MFVTYFDMRAAEKARRDLSGKPLNGRVIDVHYSVPRDVDMARTCGIGMNQGTVMVTLRNSQQTLKVNDVHKMFDHFGSIKKVRDMPGRNL